MKTLTFIETDLRKIAPFLVGIFVVTIIAFQGIIYKLLSNMNADLISGAAGNGMLMEEYVKTIGKIGFTQLIDYSAIPLLLLLFTGIAIALFGFYLWYKEWFGASKRIYMLLSIKGNRFKIFLSKLCVFVMIYSSFFGIVLLNLYISTFMMNAILPSQAVAENLVSNYLMQSISINLIIPTSIDDLLFKLCFIMMMFAILSVFVLLDRSKRIFGMISGFIYLIASISIFVYVNTLNLYTSERTMVLWIFTLSYLVVSTAISYYLLKKKVSI